MNPLLVLLSLAAQDPAAVPAAQQPPDAVTVASKVPDDPARPWKTADSIVMIVNQDVITESQLRADLDRLRRTQKITTNTEINAARMRILGERVRKRLRVQAGAILGVDEKLIDARVRDSLDSMLKRENGPVGLAKFLDSRDVTGPEVQRLLREDIYDQLYSDGLTGDAPGPLGRLTADRYVRPGSLSMYYRQSLDIPREMEELGGTVGRVRFQQIVLDVAQAGGSEAANELARSLAARIEAGEDMGLLARQYGGLREGDGVLDLEEVRLREFFPEIATFVATATPNQVSPPIETSPRNQPDVRILRLVRFLDRQQPIVPSFEDAKVQDKLRTRAQQRLEQWRLETGYTTLMRSSYVWPPEFAARNTK